ncbi:MAG TPA: ABC transporter permease [Parafilimonas sp.]|nr:ABC transporter permease [Parafilimonas sp.]
MSANVNWSIAKVHLLSRKRQTMVAILGVTFGISMFILMISFMNGTNEFLQDAMLSSTPDIHIYNDIKTDSRSSITEQYFRSLPNTIIFVDHPRPKNASKNLKNSDGIMKDLERNEQVAAVSPVVSAHVFFYYGPVQLNGIIDGVNINEEKKVLNISAKMVEGKPEGLTTIDNSILLGQGLAENLNVHTGDLVTVLTEAGNIVQLHVAGIFQFGLGAVDNIKAFMNLSDVQQLLGKDRNFVTEIHVKAKDIGESKKLANVFSQKYNYKAEDWATANASILATVVTRNVMTWVVSIALLVVAGFGIYNIMNMTIANKLKDIAILKAEGFKGRDIASIFLSQCIVIGIIGAALGITLGFVLSYLVSRIPFPKSDLVSLKFFPVIFETKYYLLAVAFGVFTTFIAGLMPSVRASKSDPVAILRG